MLRSHSGGEYVKSEYIQYCEDVGIQMQHSIPYTPQQNGVAERKNRSLKEMEIWMMEAKHFPPTFWSKTIKYASYIQNRVPHNNIYGMTPFESWGGHKPYVTHFKIFGSKAWARILIEKRKALKLQSQKCLFVGYSEYSKGYKMINLSTNKAFIERSVQFQEEPLKQLKLESLFHHQIH